MEVGRRKKALRLRSGYK